MIFGKGHDGKWGDYFRPATITTLALGSIRAMTRLNRHRLNHLCDDSIGGRTDPTDLLLNKLFERFVHWRVGQVICEVTDHLLRQT